MTNISEFAKSFVQNIFNKVNIAKVSLMRMTFIQADYCYVCDSDNQITTKEIKPDNFMGRNRYGWICCDNCEKYVNIAKKIEDEVAFPGQIKVLINRSFESTAVA